MVIKYTPVSKIIEAMIDCIESFSSKKNHPINNAITGFTYADVETFSVETTLTNS